MYIVKLGGSVITDKGKKNTFNEDIAMRLASEIYDSKKRAIVVHGAGSFGHILAKKYELEKGYKDEAQLMGLAEVQRDVKDLSLRVIDTFLKSGIKAVSLAPSSFIVNEKGKIKYMDSNMFKRYFEMGFTPVTFGDVVVDESLRFSIVSGDQIMLWLARIFKPEKVIFAADVDGIFTSDPSLPDAKLLHVIDEEILSNVIKSQGKVDDVTGSIFGKLETMFQIAGLGFETIILNGSVENRLKDGLLGKEIICSKIVKRS